MTDAVHTTGLSPAFFAAMGAYLIAASLYGLVFSRERPTLLRATRWLLGFGFVAHAVDIGWRGGGGRLGRLGAAMPVRVRAWIMQKIAKITASIRPGMTPARKRPPIEASETMA